MRLRFVALLCVGLLVLHLVLPQRANAVVAESTIIAGAAAIMASAGLTVWAADSSEFSSYLSSKLSQYVATTQGEGLTLEDWLDVDPAGKLFSVIDNGALKFTSAIANKFLDFCSWFNTTEGVGDAGPAVGIVGGPRTYATNKSGLVSMSGDTVTFDVLRTGRYIINIYFGDKTDVSKWTVTCVAASDSLGSYRWNITSSETIDSFPATSMSGAPYCVVDSSSTKYDIITSTRPYLRIYTDVIPEDVTGRLVFQLSQSVETPSRVLITPGSVVAVRPPIAEQDSLVVTTTAPIAAGASEAEASAAIIDTVVSVDGLASEDAVSEGAGVGWGWLADLIDRVIGNTDHATYQPVDEYALDLTNFFPFCIPWDVYRALSLFDEEPVTPSLTWDIPLPNGGTYRLDLDLHQFDGVAEVCRALELLLFGVYLAVSTRKLIKW